MALDPTKFKLPDSYNNLRPDNNPKYQGIFRGFVKNNEDPQCMGRLMVWIPELCGEPDDEASWITCSYGAPFAGASPRSGLVEDSTDMEGSQTSYGMWFVPPHNDAEVLVCFVNGDTAQAFWIGCVYSQNMNHMVPAIAGGAPADDYESCGTNPPVVEYNKFSKENPNNPKRPVFKPLADGIAQQGLYSDPVRGVSNAGARRAPVSNTYGFSTPRGHTVYIDEEEGQECIRLRSRSGAQILINDTTGFIYMNTKNGNSWAEMSDKGIDVYSKGTISYRAQGTLNFHADGAINIEADGNLNFRSGGNTTFQSATHTHFAGNGDLVLEFGGTLSATGKNRLVLGSGGDIQMAASGTLYEGAGGDHIVSANRLLHNTGSSVSVTPVEAVVAQPKDVQDVSGEAPCYDVLTRPTITTKFPTHEPYQDHATGDNPTPDPIYPSEVPSAEDNENLVENGDKSLVDTPLPENFTDDDLTWLTIMTWTESRGESNDGRAAVARIALNRMQNDFKENNRSPKFTGVKKYVLAQSAFSHFWYANGMDKGSVKKGDFAAAEKRGLNVYAKHKGSKVYKDIEQICREVMNGTYKTNNDVYNTINANKRTAFWFYNPALAAPAWASKFRNIGRIGGHVFMMRK